jgi:hypothetical protein
LSSVKGHIRMICSHVENTRRDPIVDNNPSRGIADKNRGKSAQFQHNAGGCSPSQQRDDLTQVFHNSMSGQNISPMLDTVVNQFIRNYIDPIDAL